MMVSGRTAPQSVQFSSSVMSDSLQPHRLQHTRPPCPSPTPGACSNSCPFKSVMPSNHLILRHPLLLLRSVFPSIRVSSSESTLCIRWPKYWSLSFNISPSSYKTTLTPHASPIASGTHPSAFCLHELQLAFPCKRSPSSFSLAHALK